jgi:hypothetical protein
MRRMSLELVAFARDLVASTLRARAPSGFSLHLSGKRFAAPAQG